MKDVNLGKTQSPVSPQQRRQWWWDSHQNDTHSIYFLMIPTMLVTSHTDLELYGLTSTMFLQYRNTQSPVSL